MRVVLKLKFESFLPNIHAETWNYVLMTSHVILRKKIMYSVFKFLIFFGSVALKRRPYSSVRKQLDLIIEFAGHRTKQRSIKQLTARPLFIYFRPLISQKTVFKRAVLSCF